MLVIATVVGVLCDPTTAHGQRHRMNSTTLPTHMEVYSYGVLDGTVHCNTVPTLARSTYVMLPCFFPESKARAGQVLRRNPNCQVRPSQLSSLSHPQSVCRHRFHGTNLLDS